MIHGGKPADLVHAVPMAELMRQNQANENEILKEISLSVSKCSDALQIHLTPLQIKTMAEDILDVYKFESVEDIILCLKQGRQGVYSDIPTYGKLNMIVFQQWMARHLEKKYAEKEKLLRNEKLKELEMPETEEQYAISLKFIEKWKKQARANLGKVETAPGPGGGSRLKEHLEKSQLKDTD